MAELLSSKIIISEEEPTIRGFPDLPTAVFMVAGVAERGPIATATLLTAYADYEKIFGGMINGRQLALAVRAFFLNGGQRAYVSRVVHYTDPSSPGTCTAVKGSAMLQNSGSVATAASVLGSTTGPWTLSPNDTLIGNVDRVGNQTVTFTATAASAESVSAETYDLSGGDKTLTLKIDRGSVQTITLTAADFSNPATATAEEVAAALNRMYGGRATATSAGTKVTITSDKKGLASYVEVTGGTANAALGFALAEAQGTGNVNDIKAVTFTEVKTRVEATWTNGSGVTVASSNGHLLITTVSTGAGSHLQVDAGSTTLAVFGLPSTEAAGTAAAPVNVLKIWAKTEGAYSTALSIKILQGSADSPAGADPARFNLQVLKAGVALETFANLTMDKADTRYVETVINDTEVGSWYISADDQDAAGTPAAIRPVNVSGAAISGGDDGLTNLDENDYIGNQSAKTGLYAFDAADDGTILAVPDAAGTAAVTTAVQKAMVNYCVLTRGGLVFAILDPRASLDTAGVLTQKDALGAEGVNEHAALYWPRLIIANPSKAIFGASAATITVCPSGYIAGVMARNDATFTEGPFYQPAGTDTPPLGVVGLETDEVKFSEKRDLIFPKRINPISYLRGYGIFIDGARTLKGDGNFPSVGERRGVSYIEELLLNGLQWVRHRNNSKALRRQVHKEVYSLLHGWMRKGAFASQDPATAFFVDVSDALNPPSVVRSGQLIIRVGMATNTPAEFVIIKVTKDTRALEAELFPTPSAV